MLRALAVELAGGLLADHLDIIVVGVAAELAELGVGSLRELADIDQAIDEFDQWAATTPAALQTQGLATAPSPVAARSSTCCPPGSW